MIMEMKCISLKIRWGADIFLDCFQASEPTAIYPQENTDLLQSKKGETNLVKKRLSFLIINQILVHSSSINQFLNSLAEISPFLYAVSFSFALIFHTSNSGLRRGFRLTLVLYRLRVA